MEKATISNSVAPLNIMYLCNLSAWRFSLLFNSFSMMYLGVVGFTVIKLYLSLMMLLEYVARCLSSCWGSGCHYLFQHHLYPCLSSTSGTPVMHTVAFSLCPIHLLFSSQYLPLYLHSVIQHGCFLFIHLLLY